MLSFIVYEISDFSSFLLQNVSLIRSDFIYMSALSPYVDLDITSFQRRDSESFNALKMKCKLCRKYFPSPRLQFLRSLSPLLCLLLRRRPTPGHCCMNTTRIHRQKLNRAGLDSVQSILGETSFGKSHKKSEKIVWNELKENSMGKASDAELRATPLDIIHWFIVSQQLDIQFIIFDIPLFLPASFVQCNMVHWASECKQCASKPFFCAGWCAIFWLYFHKNNHPTSFSAITSKITSKSLWGFLIK